MQVTPGCRCWGEDVEVHSPHGLSRAANWPEMIKRGWFLFLWEEEFCCFVFMGILVVCLLLIWLGEGGWERGSRALQLRDQHVISCLYNIGGGFEVRKAKKR